MSGNENAGGGRPTGVSEGDQLTTCEGVSMATTAAEVNSLPERHRTRALEVIGHLRVRIAKAMKELGHEAESPRHVEAMLRMESGLPRSIEAVAEVKDLTLLRLVHDTIERMNDNFRPSLFEMRCEQLGIGPDVYVDIYESLGYLPTRPLSDVAKRYIQ